MVNVVHIAAGNHITGTDTTKTGQKCSRKLNYRRKLMLHVPTLLINAKLNFSANRAARRVMDKSIYEGRLVKVGGCSMEITLMIPKTNQC